MTPNRLSDVLAGIACVLIALGVLSFEYALVQAFLWLRQPTMPVAPWIFLAIVLLAHAFVFAVVAEKIEAWYSEALKRISEKDAQR